MDRIIQQTDDGSHTLFVPSMDEHYHSVNGAIQESKHVFIEAGLEVIQKEEVHILEIGFGTGLNAFLTLQYAALNGKRIHYYTIERFPLEIELIEKLNYGEQIWPEKKDLFLKLHQVPWNEPVVITEDFILHKIEDDSNTVTLPDGIDLIYFDAFAPDKQPEMWNQVIFDSLYEHALPGAVIVTYCAKGDVRRSMQTAGFVMERLPGPPGKRHMLRGKKGIGI